MTPTDYVTFLHKYALRIAADVEKALADGETEDHTVHCIMADVVRDEIIKAGGTPA